MALYGTGTAPKTELLINGVWTNLSTRPRGENKIVITRGRANEQARTTAQTCQMSLNNRDGVLSNRNPSSAYYGLLPRNTQVRITAGAGDNYLKVPYTDSSTATGVTTTDKAVLDVVGDIDIRVDAWAHSWRPGMLMMLASKYNTTGNQRSWAFYLTELGYLELVWSTDGTVTNRIFALSTAAVPSSSTRLALRVTLKVNNGAAGNTATFYTAPTIGGSWTQLGSTVITAGTTSIFSSSANLGVGTGDGVANANIGSMTGFGGRIYAAEVYNGIAGTRVANMDATARSVGDTSWSDGLGTPNTWTVSSTARVTTDRIRFWGELSSLPQSWDKTGADVFVPVTASGMIRRLTQGANPLNSPMYRNFNRYAPNGYWALEDGSASLSAGSSVGNGLSGTCTAVTFGGSNSGIPGAASVAQLQDATSKIYMQANAATSTGTISYVVYVKVSSLPASSKAFCTFYNSGTLPRITVGLSSTNWVITFYDSTNTVQSTTNTAVTGIDPHNGWIGINILMQTSGSDLTYSIRWDAISGFGGGVGPTTVTTQTVGAPTGCQLESWADAVYNDAKFAQVFMSTLNLDLTNDNFRQASNAWLAETSVARQIRLAAEEGVALEVWGRSADSEPMGYQTTDTLMNLVYDCWDSDGGIGGECRDALSLFYRTRVDLESRSDLPLSYTSSHLSEVPLPTEDDQGFTNDVTVTRVGGGSARATITEGGTSISAPPVGVGPYSTAVERSLGTEARTSSVAGWMALVGSWDDARYPNLTVGLHRTEILSSSTLLLQVIGAEFGDTATLSGLPSWLPPDSVPELIQGYTETLGKFMWDIVYNCTPAGAYQSVPLLDNDQWAPRMDATTGHSIGVLNTTATSMSLVTASGSSVWADSATYPNDFPFTVKVTGEVMTVTAITGTTSPQTATVTRSVNGVVKAHLVGESIRLEHPFYIGR